MTEYITYASLVMNGLMLTALLNMRSHLDRVQTQLDLALEMMEAQANDTTTTTDT